MSKNYTELPMELEAIFNLAPEVELSKKDKKILKMICCLGESDFFTVLDCLDMRPSKLDKHIARLEELGLVDFDDEEDMVYITDAGAAYALKNGDERKEDKRFRKFLASLTPEEVDDFVKMYSDLTEAEPLEEEAEEELPEDEAVESN